MIKLISLKMGINIIAEVIDDSVYSITVKSPAAIFVQPQNGQVMIGFSPFLQYSTEFSTGIPLKKEDVLCVQLTPFSDVAIFPAAPPDRYVSFKYFMLRILVVLNDEVCCTHVVPSVDVASLPASPPAM